MGHLVTNAGLLKKIKSFLLTGVASSNGVVLKKTALAGMVNISILFCKYSDVPILHFPS